MQDVVYIIDKYHNTGGAIMETAKIFTNGRSQAVRLPKKYRFPGKEVRIRRQGNSVILSPISGEDTLQAFLELPGCPDFTIDRDNAQEIQHRELF